MVLISHLYPGIIKACRGLILEDDKLREYMVKLNSEINKGLNVDTYEDAAVKCLMTYIYDLPEGIEEGNFIVLDFGGPIFRILLVSLQDKECMVVTSKQFEVPEELMTGKGEQLFDFIAKCLSEVIKSLRLKERRIPLAFTFGFPLEKSSFQNGRLVRWTKGFDCKNFVNEDIFIKIRASMRKFQNLKRIYLIGIVNDTTGCLMAGCWRDPNCRISVIVGEGCNIAYLEYVDHISKFDGDVTKGRMIINLESGALGDDGVLDFIRTDYDIALDEGTNNPGQQLNEKMISRMYLGELARLVLVNVIEQGLIFGGYLAPSISKKGAITTEQVSQIESDPEKEYVECRKVLDTFGYMEVSDEDCIQVQFICRCLSRRSANLVAASLAAIVDRLRMSEVTIAADGSMIREYPHYTYYMSRKLRQLKNKEYECDVIEVQDGTGQGAAVAAAAVAEAVMDRDEKFRCLPPMTHEKCGFIMKKVCEDKQCAIRHIPCDGKNNPNKPLISGSKDII